MHVIAKKIKQARLSVGWQQAELARAINVSAQLISAFENGRIVPAGKYVKAIAVATRQPMAFFTGQKVPLVLKRIDQMMTELTELRQLVEQIVEDDLGHMASEE